MTELTKEIASQHEDRIKDIFERVSELYSFSNILYSAVLNKSDAPEINDLENSIYMLMEHLEVLKNDLHKHLEFCEESGLFGQMQSIKQ